MGRGKWGSGQKKNFRQNFYSPALSGGEGEHPPRIRSSSKNPSIVPAVMLYSQKKERNLLTGGLKNRVRPVQLYWKRLTPKARLIAETSVRQTANLPRSHAA